MTQRKRLQKLRVSFECRLNRLKKKVHPFLVSRISSDREAVVTYAAIECLNAWSNFVRAYYLSCAIGTTTESGDKVTPSIPILTCTDAIGIAITVFRPYSSATGSGRWLRRDEPTWHDPNTLLRLSARLGFSNLADIQAGMSAGFRVFADLPVCRNFFAHRNEHSGGAARRLALLYAIPGSPRPSSMLCSYPHGRPQALILEWIDELVFTAQYLCH